MHDIVLHCASYTMAMPCHALPGEVHGVAPARCFTSLEALLADDELDILVRALHTVPLQPLLPFDCVAVRRTLACDMFVTSDDGVTHNFLVLES